MKNIFIIFIIMITNFAHAAETTFECIYPSNASYSEGKINVGYEDFSLKFLIDMEAGKATMIGNNGSNPVFFSPQENGFTMIERTGTGNTIITTIHSSMKSVHSRNSIIFENLLPSQYYGSCKIISP